MGTRTRLVVVGTFKEGIFGVGPIWQRWGLSESACVIAAEVNARFSTSLGSVGSSKQWGVSLGITRIWVLQSVGTIEAGPLTV